MTTLKIARIEHNNEITETLQKIQDILPNSPKFIEFYHNGETISLEEALKDIHTVPDTTLKKTIYLELLKITIQQKNRYGLMMKLL